MQQRIPVWQRPTDNKSLFGWEELLSWTSIGWWVALSVGVWGALMGTGDYDVANVFFTLAGLLFIFQWGKVTHIHRPERKVVLFVIGLLVTLLAVGIVLRWTGHKAKEAEAQRQQLNKLSLVPILNSSITTLTTTLQTAETGRQVDAAYFKAKLEDAYRANDDLRKFAPAMMKLAETSADLSKKQYDQKVLDNNQLRTFVTVVIKRMRDLENQYQLTSRQQTDASWQKRLSRTRPNSPLTPQEMEEMKKQIITDQQEETTANMLLRSQYEQVYRSTVMGDAQYARRELLGRIGGDAFLSPQERTRTIALDGILAGPSPIGDAANYLDALLRRLSP